MINELLKFRGRFFRLPLCKVGFAANIRWIHIAEECEKA